MIMQMMSDSGKALREGNFVRVLKDDRGYRIGRMRSIVYSAMVGVYCTKCIGILRRNEREDIHRA